MIKGFVKLHKKLLKSDLWKMTPPFFKLAILCLLKASGNDFDYYVREIGEYVPIKRGQFISSTRKLAEELKLSINRTQRGIKNLEKINFLARSPEHQRYSIFTIKNYAKYNPKKTDLEHSIERRVER